MTRTMYEPDVLAVALRVIEALLMISVDKI